MKIVQKLTLLFILGISAVLAANAYLRVSREVALFETDRLQNQSVSASGSAAAVSSIWRTDGRERALMLVGQLDQRAPKLEIGWLSLDDHSFVDTATIERLRSGSIASFEGTDAKGAKLRCSYAPVSPVSIVEGAVGVCEPFAIQDAYVHQTIAETAVTMLTLVAVCSVIAALLGAWVVGRPISALADKARRIGEGDFSRPLVPRGHDEIAMLSNEMNAMCARLVEAAEKVEAETKSRIAAIEQLRHADRLVTVGKLASGLAHELGTPLNVVEARAEMIASGETDPEETKSYARVITEATERMTKIVRQLLDFARRGNPQTGPHEMLSIAQRVATLLAPLAGKKQVIMHVAGSRARALVDPDQMQQVLANLIVNAIHASNASGEIEIVVSEEKAQLPADIGEGEMECVRLRVRDHGAGIAAEDLARVFEPFFTTKDVGEGTGLGLAVAYGIVRDHGGWIDVVSDRASTTEFSV
ncbi:MAG: HAMP domain-containing sensor histidine kinase, partial [Polyangiaceae bacterium]